MQRWQINLVYLQDQHLKCLRQQEEASFHWWVNMEEEKMAQNREDIIKINGELRLINQKLDNHIHHLSEKIDTIFKIVWTVSFMVLGLILKAIYTAMM